jgi:hypothetical protein
MREINLAFFLPFESAPVLGFGFLAAGLSTSAHLVTAIGKLVGGSGSGLGSKTL